MDLNALSRTGELFMLLIGILFYYLEDMEHNCLMSTNSYALLQGMLSYGCNF